jgi:hypothetical protein
MLYRRELLPEVTVSDILTHDSDDDDDDDEHISG